MTTKKSSLAVVEAASEDTAPGALSAAAETTKPVSDADLKAAADAAAASGDLEALEARIVGKLEELSARIDAIETGRLHSKGNDIEARLRVLEANTEHWLSIFHWPTPE